MSALAIVARRAPVEQSTPPISAPPVGGGGGGGGGGGSSGCSFSQDYGHFAKGAAPSTQQFTLTNNSNAPFTIQGATLQQPGQEWSADLSQLHGVLQPGQTVIFSVTFTPPAK